MSKDFDTSLSDALDSVARAARSAGPAAAQIRGRKRTMRKRVALSTVSLVLVAAAATTAFKLTSSSNNVTPPVMSSSSPSIATSSAPTIAVTSGVPTSGSTGSSTSSPPAVSSTTATSSGSASTSSSASADPHTVIPAAWLNADQMPFAGTYSWKAQPARSVGPEPLTSTVGYIPNTTNYQALTSCGDPAKLISRTTGGQAASFAGPTSSTGSYQAVQYIFFFTNATSARQAYTWLQDQYTSGCGGITSYGAKLTEVGSEGTSGAAWLTLKGTAGFPDMPIYDREYFVLRGSTIAYVYMISPKNLTATYDDAAELSTIAAHLCVYGGSCD